MTSRKKLSRLNWLLPVTILLMSTLGVGSAQAGTAAYWGRCSFFDRDDNHGGGVAGMPCYVVEGVTRNRAFFHIAWKDGVKTRLEHQVGNAGFKDSVTRRTYQRKDQATFVADGDMIYLDDATYTPDRYNIDDPILMKLLAQKSVAPSTTTGQSK